jgi:signal transduction histidine kinase
MNIFLTTYMQESRPFRPLFIIERETITREISEEQMGLIKESRLKDLENIRVVSIYSVVPLTLISFLVGYIIASRMLKPLEDLDKEMRSRNADNFDSPIKYEDKGDEISSLIEHFNDMSKRVSDTFKSQKEFVENASHEIRTPLAIIQANLDNALSESNIPKKELNELLLESQKSVTFMTDLTDDLLLLSLISSNMNIKKIDLRKLLLDSESFVKHLAKDFKINIYCEDGIKIKGNRSLLTRAFQNIMENAIKYSEGTKLDITVKKENNKVIITLKDDGKGMEKELCKKIFNRFYRVDKSRSRNLGGSGLGLSITKEIIEKHNGSIECKSEKGKGCEFDISLPIYIS